MDSCDRSSYNITPFAARGGLSPSSSSANYSQSKQNNSPAYGAKDYLMFAAYVGAAVSNLTVFAYGAASGVIYAGIVSSGIVKRNFITSTIDSIYTNRIKVAIAWTATSLVNKYVTVQQFSRILDVVKFSHHAHTVSNGFIFAAKCCSFTLGFTYGIALFKEVRALWSQMMSTQRNSYAIPAGRRGRLAQV